MSDTPHTAHPLAHRTIGVPESRQLDLFADMLSRRGAVVVRCPLVDIHDAPDPAPIRAWVDDVLAHGLDEMIWLTGEGVRRLDDFVGALHAGTAPAFWQRLGAARTVTRGPKPGRELRQHGIRSDVPANQPTTAGVIEALQALDLSGHRVGVQLYGTDPNTPLMTALIEAGATALPVAPYVYADDAEDDDVTRFIEQICSHTIDAVAFTSSPQVKRLFKVARRHDREADLKTGLADLCVAAVGPKVAESLAEQGVSVALIPADNYFMKPLVRELASYFDHPPAA